MGLAATISPKEDASFITLRAIGIQAPETNNHFLDLPQIFIPLTLQKF